MATDTEAKRSQGRRAAREAKQAQNETEAKKQLVESTAEAAPAKSTAAARREAEAAHLQEPLIRAKTDSKQKKKQARAAQESAARQQARKDALLMPPPPEAIKDDTPIGEAPPLHVLNARSRVIESEERAAATEIATEIGRNARDLMMGRELRGRHARGRRRAEIEAFQARQKKSE